MPTRETWLFNVLRAKKGVRHVVLSLKRPKNSIIKMPNHKLLPLRFLKESLIMSYCHQDSSKENNKRRKNRCQKR